MDTMKIKNHDSYFRSWKSLVDAQLQTWVPEPNNSNQLVQHAMYYAVESGHRWRPLLLISAYELVGKDATNVLDAACAIEMAHCCTLMLDDLPSVDNSAFRRGRPSCHMVYGEAVTIYASHLLYALAERISYENAIRLKVDGELVWLQLDELRERLVETQEIEINLSQGNILPDDDILTRFYELKSSPFVTAAWLAATLGNVEALTRERLTKYAMYLGIAYQLADDIADVKGEISEMGKPVGMDQDKINFVTHYGLNQSKEMARMFMNKGEKLLDLIPGDTTTLCSLMYRIVGPVISPSFV
jgi:geranylgeranyl diphosphate synthase, type II